MGWCGEVARRRDRRARRPPARRRRAAEGGPEVACRAEGRPKGCPTNGATPKVARSVGHDTGRAGSAKRCRPPGGMTHRAASQDGWQPAELRRARCLEPPKASGKLLAWLGGAEGALAP